MPKTSQKHFDDQFDDEEVLFVFRKHPIVMRKGLVFGALGPLIGVLPAAIHPELGMAWFFAGLVIGLGIWGLVLLPFWIAWFYSVFIVTDQRLIQITQKGLFHRTVVDLTLSQIQMVNYQIAGLQETLLGYGTIMMQTYVGDLVIHDVHHPAQIQKKVLGVLREQGIVANNLPMNKETADEATEAE
ncbi:MAG TPA: PH domain-containing protein [Patescibacteria group bacterium]|nr:PH domain-containing protein [Patescibacteria group bacterium]